MPNPFFAPGEFDHSMSETHRPRLAAKVILLRSAKGKGFEAFLIRDPDHLSSLGFPGGAVTKDDCSSGMLHRCHGLSATVVRNIIGARFTPQEASSPWIAGIRTLFLEVGVLLATNEAGQDPMLGPERTVRLQNQRGALRARSLTFESLLEQERLWGDASKLLYFSCWQIALQSDLRFNTHFYLASLSPDESAFPALPQAVHGLWLSPDRAMFLCNRGELAVGFSTFASLRTLAEFNSAQSVFQEYGSGTRG